MFKIFSALLIVLTISLQVWAQCSINFKEESRQVLSDAITHSYFEDFDNDGKQDLLGVTPLQYIWSSGRVDYQFHFYKRLSDNSFDTTAKSTIINEGRLINNFVFGDVNGDGFKDLIIRHSTSPATIKTYLNDGTGSFSTVAPTLIANDNIWAASDLNGDGKADLIVTATNGLNYRLAQPDNSFGAPVFIAAVSFGLTSAHYLTQYVNYLPLLVDDLNNDGLKDIAMIEGNSNYVLRVLTNTGNLTFTQSPDVQFGPTNANLKAYDFNNDGKKDFVSAYGASGIGVRLAVNNGNNTFTSSHMAISQIGSQNRFGDTYSTRTYSAADFDNDGDVDIIYPGTRTGVLMRNQGNATFVREELKAFPGIDQIANLDNDGKPDSVYLNYSIVNGIYRLWDGTNWNYYHRHNAVSFRKNVCNPVGQTKIIDFNGDGSPDRAFWNPTTGFWRYYPEEAYISNNQVYYQFGSQSFGDVPVPNDYDGDGKTDYAVYRKSSGTWWIVGSSGQSNFGFNFGITEDKPVPADYDGDGKADIAVYRPSTSVWHLWLSETNQYRAIQFGIAEDKVVPADYDGDGKADIAVWRPSTQVWYILKSSDGSFQAVQYGLSTDKPVPGDYDGDGKANITLYRDGVWYVLKSDYSTAGIYFGSAGDTPFFNDRIVSPAFGVYRQSSSAYFLGYSTFSDSYAQPTGNSASEIFVSSILPPQ